MIEDDRYSVERLIQISAVRATPHRFEVEILCDHVSYCVACAFT